MIDKKESRGRPQLPTSELKSRARLVRLQDERDAHLIAVAKRKGIAPATLMRSYIYEALEKEIEALEESELFISQK